MKKTVLVGLIFILAILFSTDIGIDQNPLPIIKPPVKAKNLAKKPQPKTPVQIYNEAAYLVKIFAVYTKPIILITESDSTTTTSESVSTTTTIFLGSGSIIKSKTGFCVLTARHVIENKTTNSLTFKGFYARFKNDSSLQGLELICSGTNYDTAILSFTDPEFKPKNYAKIGKSSQLTPGSTIICLGSGQYGDFWFSTGHIFVCPGLPNDLVRSATSLIRWPTMILSDTPIFFGFSGGPTLNEKGELIGITVGFMNLTRLTGEPNLSIGLPIDDILKEFPDLF